MFHVQLGLAEKNILNYDFDLVESEHSDPNTNSTTLLSDDTDDKSWKCVNREMCLSTMQQEEAGYKVENQVLSKLLLKAYLCSFM